MSRKGLCLTLVAVAAVVSLLAVGIGYAISVSYTGTTVSTENSTTTTFYELDIYRYEPGVKYEEGKGIDEPLFLPSPGLLLDESGVHKTVVPTVEPTEVVIDTETVKVYETNTTRYRLYTGEDYSLGAHIRMFAFMNDLRYWIFIDSIRVSISGVGYNCDRGDDGDITEASPADGEKRFVGTYECSIPTGASGACTDVMVLLVDDPGTGEEGEHVGHSHRYYKFTVTVRFKESVNVDDLALEQEDLDSFGLVVGFVYDDQDPVPPTVHYDLDGGTSVPSVPADIGVQAGNEVTIADVTVSKEGYDFTGWAVYKDGDPETTVTVVDGKFTMPAYSVVIKAQYTEAEP